MTMMAEGFALPMWEAIASNRRRSWLLVSLMGLILIALGAAIGGTLDPQVGLPYGVLAAVGLWLLLWLLAVGAGDSILLSSARAYQIGKEDVPQLWNVVEEMTIAAGLPRMPRVYIIDDSSMNAFAVGRRPQNAAVAVTTGLLKRLDRDELQGVIAHEIGHIRNLDVKFMTLASVMVGAIVLISDVFLRGVLRSGGRRRSSRHGGGQAQVILLLLALALAIVGPLVAQLLYFACSRRREYLADASSALFTRYPEGLASALEKISGQAGLGAEVNKVVAPLCIVNPLQDRAAFSLFATHPPTAERVRILRSMAGAGLAAYEAAYRAVRGRRARCIGPRSLESSTDVDLRQPAPGAREKSEAVVRARAVGELLDHFLPMVIITCPCGARLKLPPDFKRNTLRCPRCGQVHEVPRAQTGPQPGPSTAQPLRYRRRGAGWESFQCACGHPVQLSPKFNGTHIRCPNCKQQIDVTP